MGWHAGPRGGGDRSSIAALVVDVGFARALGASLVVLSAGIGLATFDDGEPALRLALAATGAHGLVLSLRLRERPAVVSHVALASTAAIVAVLSGSLAAAPWVGLATFSAFALPSRGLPWVLALVVVGLHVLLVPAPGPDALWPLSMALAGYLLANLGRRASALYDAELARRAEADAASISKEDFLSNVSHEIRTPMSGILGMADAILRRRLSDEVREPIEVMRRSTEAVLTIVDEILDFSKISAVGITLHISRFDLRALIAEVIALHRPSAEAKGLRLVAQVAIGIPRALTGDPGRVRQVITNLVSNAIKFTSRGHVELTVEGRIDGDVCWTKIRITDSGHGIAADFLERIFDPFVQAVEHKHRRGTGLGLAIARRLAVALGGTLSAESVLREGSTFTLEVPLRISASERSLLPEPEPQPQGAEAEAERAAPPPPAPAPAAERPLEPSTAARRAQILVVDDDPINRLVAATQLEELGHAVSVADGGIEALEMLGARRFDLVVMDCQMPDLDGFETTRTLRAREPEGERTPVIALTANASIDIRGRCAAAGMDGHLSKPTRLEALERAITPWLRCTSEDPGRRDPTRRPSEQH